MSSIVEHKLEYDFYKEYINVKKNNNNFETIMNRRIDKIKELYFLSSLSREEIIKEYFVEIFCWTVLPKKLLEEFGILLKENNIGGIIDPCCGNAFHTYLFNTFLDLEVFSVDIQDETHSWTPIKEEEGRLFMKNMPEEKQINKALLLSWVDYDSLTQDLLKLYKGNIILSLGNYTQNLSKNYIKDLNETYKLIKAYNMKMPWGLEEKIEIYKRK